MPRTRSQASVSPLVSLDAPRRRKRPTPSSTTDTASQDEVTTKLKRARKPKVATTSPVEALQEEVSQNKSENPMPITPQLKEPKEEPKAKEFSNPPTILDHDVDNKFPSLASCEATPCPPAATKKRPFKRALTNVKEVLKKPRESIRQRFKSLRKAPGSKDESQKKMITIGTAPETQYSLSEDQILEAAIDILLGRMESDQFDQVPSEPSFLRCPCCQGSLECPDGHDLHSWVPNDVTESMNALLTTVLAEGICVSSEEKQEQAEQVAREAEERRQVEEQRQAEEKRLAEEKLQTEKRKAKKKLKAKPDAKNSEATSQRKGKKRSRETTLDDESHDDGEPSSQRPRLTPSYSPYKRRTTSPRRKLTYAEIRQRAKDREEGNGPPSMFHLDRAIAQHEAQEKAEEAARKAAEEAAETERLQNISRAHMERHAVLGPVPENARSSLEIPIFSDETQDVKTPDLPDTPSSSTWGIQVRNIFSSVTGSVRRFVPRFRNVTDQTVPFVAGGGATPTTNNRAVTDPVQSGGAGLTSLNGTLASSAGVDSQAAKDLTYSLFPPKIAPPQNPAKSTVDATTQGTEKTGVATSSSPEKAEDQSTQHTTQIPGNEKRDEAHTDTGNGNKKRKRPPTPEKIPNPPGVSYGLHDDWFTYSDDEIEEIEQLSAVAESEKPPEKKVRIQSPPKSPPTTKEPIAEEQRKTTESAAPYIPPGWSRPTTTVYNGTMFKGMRHEFTPRSYTPSRSHRRPLDMAEYLRTKAEIEAESAARYSQPSSGSLVTLRKEKQEYRKLNVPKSVVSDFLSSYSNCNSERTNQPQSSRTLRSFRPGPLISTPSTIPEEPATLSDNTSSETSQPFSAPKSFENAYKPSGNAFQPSGNASKSASITSEQTSTSFGENALAEPTNDLKPNGTSVGEPAETVSKPHDAIDPHKPKKPSLLRNPTRFSSSPISQPSPTQALSEQTEEDLVNVFGEDEYGQQAYDVYKNCPSGDLKKMNWPKFALLPKDKIQQLVNSTHRSEKDDEIIRDTFKKSFADFQNQLRQGLIDTDEILEDLPL